MSIIPEGDYSLTSLQLTCKIKLSLGLDKYLQVKIILVHKSVKN